LLDLGSKLSLPGYDRHVLAGFQVVSSASVVKSVTVKPIFDLNGEMTFTSDGQSYVADPSFSHAIQPFCPAWHLLTSVNSFTGVHGGGMQTGQKLVPQYLSESTDLIGQTLRLRGQPNALGEVTAIGRPIEVRDWNGNSMIVTETIELTALTGQADIAGKIGGVFATVGGSPIGSLVSRSNERWFLAPILPYLSWSEQKYCDPIMTKKKELFERLNNATTILDKVA
jgi:hypothetical protein